MRTVTGTAALLGLALGASAQYTPDWSSLDARPLPGWYDEAKFGIFMHWGVYSVPSWGVPSGGASGEWFEWEWLGANNSAYAQFMEENYPPGFTYADFASQFKAELFDPDVFADVIAGSGAKYFVLTSKHHEGFTNWPSKYSWNWNAVDVGPHQDLVGALAQSVRARNVTFGLYYSLFEWFHPLYLQDKAAGFNTTVYVDTVMLPQLYEVVNAYQPDLIWSDGDWEASDTYWKSRNFLAWLYNSSPVKDTVVVNDRWGSGDTCVHGGYYTCTDRYNPGKLINHKWENAYTVDKWSWGFRRNAVLADFVTSVDIISELVSTVSCGGNFLLNVGPEHDGTIDPIFQARLADVGSWLAVNGDAIYGTVPWRVQNDTAAGTTWYTAKGGAVFATFFSWPADNVLTLNAPISTASTSATLVGVQGSLSWKAAGGSAGILVSLPVLTPSNIPSQFAWVVQLTGVQ